MPTVLIADDEKNLRATLSRSLQLEGYATAEAGDGESALKRLASGEIDAMILDLQMPGCDGLEVLERMKQRGTGVPTLVLTAHATIDRAVRAVRLGAFDFIEKPPVVERILLALDNALRVNHLESENRRLASEAGLSGEILGESEAVRELIATIERVAPTDAPVLVEGENGTGKELVARAIHALGARRARAAVTVNCAAIPETLFESELFGHRRGAFTGATEARRGKFQQADRGTLFLDEVGEIPPALQPKLLRALESGEVERIGGNGSERVDVRVIAATNRDLAAEVSAGRFRQDLYYRLMVIPILVPPLRERERDAVLLARHFLDAACRRNRVRPRRLTEGAECAILRHHWPGNVRELRNTMERIAILVADAEIGARHVESLLSAPASPGGASPDAGPGTAFSSAAAAAAAAAAGPVALAEEMTRHERELVLAALERNGWRMSRAASELGLERSHLYKKLKALGIERPD